MISRGEGHDESKPGLLKSDVDILSEEEVPKTKAKEPLDQALFELTQFDEKDKPIDSVVDGDLNIGDDQANANASSMTNELAVIMDACAVAAPNFKELETKDMIQS